MEFLEPLLIWLATCFPFFIPLIIPVGSYGFYKHAARHTDGTDDIQNATSVQKGLMTAVQAEEVDSISPEQWGILGGLTTHPIGGDGTAGRILRGIRLKIDDGSVAATLKCTVTDRGNGDIIAETDNIPKGGGAGHFTLSGTGKDLAIEASGLSGKAIYTLGFLSSNASGVALLGYTYISADDIHVGVTGATDGVGVDLTDLVNGPKLLYFEILYITDT